MKAVPEFQRRRVLQLYPQLEHAVAPVPLGEKRHNFSPDSVYRNPFWADQREAFELRQAADACAVIVVRAEGFCLYPLRWDGNSMCFDPTMPARHGDIVLFQHPDGSEPHLFMSKMLVQFGGEYWLASKDKLFPLGDTRILGVEVRLPSPPSEVLSNVVEA